MNTNEAFLFYEEKIDRPMQFLVDPDEKKKRLPWLLQPQQKPVDTTKEQT